MSDLKFIYVAVLDRNQILHRILCVHHQVQHTIVLSFAEGWAHMCFLNTADIHEAHLVSAPSETSVLECVELGGAVTICNEITLVSM